MSASGAGAVWHEVAPGLRLQLWPQRAAYAPDVRALLVADAHLGKAVSFRRWGVPVPEATTADTLARLDALIDATGCAIVVFLGDLLHSARSHAPSLHAAVRAWRAAHAARRFVLVRGNHDARAGDPPADWGIEVVDGPWRLGPWSLVHAPDDLHAGPTGDPHRQGPDGGAEHPVAAPAEGAAQPRGYVLAGHIHPGATLRGRGGDHLRLPCFHFGPRVGVLPAFGDFTGLHVLPAAREARRYVVADATVCAV